MNSHPQHVRYFLFIMCLVWNENCRVLCHFLQSSRHSLKHYDRFHGDDLFQKKKEGYRFTPCPFSKQNVQGSRKSCSPKIYHIDSIAPLVPVRLRYYKILSDDKDSARCHNRIGATLAKTIVAPL